MERERERSKVYPTCTTGIVRFADHLARFVWHQNPVVTTVQTGLQQRLEPCTTEEISCHGCRGRGWDCGEREIEIDRDEMERVFSSWELQYQL